MSLHLLDVEAGEPKRKGAVQRMMILRTGEGKSKTRCRAVACMSICQKGATATTTEEDNRKSTRWKSEYQAAPRQRRCDEILRQCFGEASVKVFFGNNSHRWPHYLVITVKFNDVVTSIKTYSEVFRQTHFGHWFRLNMNNFLLLSEQCSPSCFLCSLYWRFLITETQLMWTMRWQILFCTRTSISFMFIVMSLKKR